MNFQSLIKTNGGIGLLFLRLGVGLVFMGHGLQKLGYFGGGGHEGAVNMMVNLGLPMPHLMAWLITLAEAGGGFLIIIGFLTRFAALSTAIGMTVAVFLVHWDNGLLGQGGYQWALVMLVASLCLMFEGAGRYSLDHKLSRR